LCLGTTIILKMAIGTPNSDSAQKSWSSRFNVPPDKLKLELQPEASAPKRSPALALITLIPLVWLLAVTFTAGAEKIWSSDPRIGFLAQADVQSRNIETAHIALNTSDDTAYQKASKDFKVAIHIYANQIIDAVVTGLFLILVTVIVLLSIREWILLLSKQKPAVLHETEPVWLPDYALKESGPNLRSAAGAAALTLGLAKELSGETQFERARQHACICEQHSDKQVFAQVTEERFNGVRRCC
jgi:carbon starvation protein